jgi:hypothetical protein
MFSGAHRPQNRIDGYRRFSESTEGRTSVLDRGTASLRHPVAIAKTTGRTTNLFWRLQWLQDSGVHWDPRSGWFVCPDRSTDAASNAEISALVETGR